MPEKAQAASSPRTGGGELRLRPLVPADLEAVVALDAELGGRPRHLYFEKRLAAALRDPPGHIQFAVESAGRLVGFILARVETEEFGRAGSAVDFETIGVAAAAQGHGVGRMLLDGVVALMRRKGMGELQTEALWTDHRLLAFLDAAGFELAPRQVIGRAVGDGGRT
jgi:ribosomal protein S18 acetylase RimI-like enzyme